jgi:chromosome segregation ATPase
MTFQILIILLIILLLLSICLIILNSINLTNKKLGGVKSTSSILLKYGGTMERVREAVDKLIADYRKKKSEKVEIEKEKNAIKKERDGLTSERDELALERDRLTSERDRLALERDKLTLEVKSLQKELKQTQIRPIKQNIEFDNKSKISSEYYGNNPTATESASSVHELIDNESKNAEIADKTKEIKDINNIIKQMIGTIKKINDVGQVDDATFTDNVSQLHEIERIYKVINKQNDILKERNKKLQTLLDSKEKILTNTIQSTNRKIAQKEEDLYRLEQIIEKKDKELENLAKEIQKLKDEIKTLNDENKLLTTDRDTDNLIKSQIIADIEKALEDDDNI